MTVTDWIMLAVVIFGVISDLWLLKVKGAEKTYSFRLYYLSCEYPLIPFLFGMLMGHLFWPQVIR